ncbi:hypothetical protein MYU51_021761 [Penicillium brevicompactum]
MRCEIMDKRPPGPNQEPSPIPSFSGDANDISRASGIIRGHQAILQLLRYVEESLPALQQATIALNGSDAAMAEPEAIHFDIRLRIDRIETLVEQLSSEI